jgi:hypothetical protein
MTPLPTEHVVPFGPTRAFFSLILFVLATAVHVELCRAQMREVVPEGVEVLTRGPVHEAFAGLQSFNPQPGRIVAKPAPPLIEEVPPSQRPAGVNIAWIPGYWTWDDERMNFVWLSGTWRALPPGREWAAGYWAQVPSGYQWTSGYWAESANRQAIYLPPPPPSVETGPSALAPSADFVWIPGCWIWFQARYAWQPGFWSLGRPDWDWIAAHNIWTPRGHVFVTGYWDRPVEHRGLLFAPVHFDPLLVGAGHYRYAPWVAVDLNLFGEHLFLRPSFQHYYFGDYYAASYTAGGFLSSSAFTRGRFGHDPIHAHQVWEHRRDPGWHQRSDAAFRDRQDHPFHRPARAWTPAEDTREEPVPTPGASGPLARPYNQLLQRDQSPSRYQTVTSPERTLLKTRTEDVERSRELRRVRETASPKASRTAPANPGPDRVRSLRSPIRSLPNRQLPGALTPPKAHRSPRPGSDPIPPGGLKEDR